MQFLLWVSAAGVAAGSIFGLDRASSPWWGAAGVAMGLITLLGRGRWAAPFGLLLFCFALGAFNASARGGISAVAALAPEVPVCMVEGRVLEQVGGLGTLLSVEALDCEDGRLTGSLGTLVIDGPAGAAGGAYRGEGRIVPLGRSGFDNARRRSGADAVLGSTDLVFEEPAVPARRVASGVRTGLRNASDGLEARRGALLRGLAIGDTSDMDVDTTSSFRRAGLSHLVAVSGSNVAIVVGAVVWAAAAGGMVVQKVVAGVALVLFVLIVGPEPSVLRAAAMGAIALLAFGRGRTSSSGTLALALVSVLLWRPAMVASAGLQLSVGATAGLILWARPLAQRLHRLPTPLAVAAGATLAAQAAVAPILVALFGEISLAAPLANVLAVPAVAPATVLGLTAGVLGALHTGIGGGLARLAEPFVGWILWVGDRFGPPEWSAARVPSGVGWVLAVLVGGAALGSIRSRRGDPSTPTA